MSELILASWQEPLEVRNASDRIVSGLVVPWMQPAAIMLNGRRTIELMRRGALNKSIQQRGDRIAFTFQHPRANDSNAERKVIGVAVDWEDTELGQRASFKISKTRLGDEALELIADGAMRSLSVGFAPLASRTTLSKMPDGTPVAERHEIAVDHVALVDRPAFDTANIDQVRSFLQMKKDRDPRYEAMKRQLDLARAS